MKKKLPEKTLILKTFSALFLLVLVFLFLNLFYNQKYLLAQDEIEYGQLECGKEIPLGEAMEKTHDLLREVIRELDSIYHNASYQIIAAEEMISLANQCNVSQCKPVDCGKYKTYYPCYPCKVSDPVYWLICLEWSTCDREHCSSPSPCASIWSGQACAQSAIHSESGKIQSAYNSIESSNNKIFDLIDGQNELLCHKTNEDIRGGMTCSAFCLQDPTASGCPKTNTREAIKRKLYLSRNEFDKCYTPPADWEKIERGETSGKFLLNCPLVIEEGFSYYTKTTKIIGKRETPVCTSLHNWFCCFSYDLDSTLSGCKWISGNTCPVGSKKSDYDYCGTRPVDLMTCCCPDL